MNVALKDFLEHSPMRPISSQEMIEVSKFILERLRVNDEIQFNALVQSTRDLRDNKSNH